MSTPTPPSGRDEFSAAYQECASELATLARTSAIEFDVQQLYQIDAKERELFDILFDMAADYLADPGSEQRYTSAISAPAPAVQASTTLTRALERMERVVSAPLGTLKELSSRPLGAPAAYEQPALRAATKIVHASAKARACCVLIDLTVSLLLATVVTILTAFAQQGSVFEVIELATSGDPVNYLPLFSLFLQCALLVSVLYPLISLFTTGRTRGLRMCSLKVLCSSGANLRLENALVRCLTFPLSLVCGGFLPVLFGKPSLSDRLSRTIVCRR